jgi:diguanylate cyclase (GGDEF)-like protein
MEQDRSVAELVYKIKELSIFNEIAKILNSSLDLKEVLSMVMRLIASLVKAEAWSVALIDRATDELVFQAATGEMAHKVTELRLKMGQGVAGWVAKERRPAIIQDVTSDPRFFSGVDDVTEFKTKSILCVPLISRGTLVGVIEIINKEGGKPFTENDLKLISSLVDHAAIAIHNTELYERTMKKVKQLSLIYELGTAITSILTLNEMLQKAADLIRNSLNCHYIAVFLKETSEDEITLKAFSGPPGVSPLRMKIRIGEEGLIGWSLVAKKAILVDDVQKEPKYLRGIEGVRSELVAPLLKEGKVLGAIDIGSNFAGAFTQDDIPPIEQLASQISIAIENATLYERVGTLAVTDDLTKLYNSRYCHMFLQKSEGLAKATGNPLSLIFLDADYFKVVNDTYGHHHGAATLKELAERISSSLRDGDVASRYGGDEYVVILPATGAEEAQEIAERIRIAVEERPFLIDKSKNHKLTISLGVATYPDCAKSAWDLLIKADQAMYHVKETGRNRVHVAPKLSSCPED